jgi:hypothetical protein
VDRRKLALGALVAFVLGVEIAYIGHSQNGSAPEVTVMDELHVPPLLYHRPVLPAPSSGSESTASLPESVVPPEEAGPNSPESGGGGETEAVPEPPKPPEPKPPEEQ